MPEGHYREFEICYIKLNRVGEKNVKTVKRRRVLAAASAFYITGILSYSLPAVAKLVLAAVLCILLCGLAVAFRKERSETVGAAFFAALAAVLALLLFYFFFDVRIGSFKKYEGEPRTVELQVNEILSANEFSTVASVDVFSIDNNKVSAKAELYLEYEYDLSENDIVTLTAQPEQFKEYENGFPLRKYELSKGRIFRLVSSKNDLKIRKPEKLTFFQRIADMRRNAASELSVLLGKENGGFASAILFGERSNLEQTLKRDFRRLGISHLLAISGMHLAILTGGVDMLLKGFRIRKRVRCIFITVFIVFFAAFSGFTSSVLRASAMLLMNYLAYFLTTERDKLTSLASAAALICLFNPPAVLDCGLQLSVAATLGLILADETKNRMELERTVEGEDGSVAVCDGRKEHRTKIKNKIKANVVGAFAPVMTSLPLMWIYFGEMSVVSPIATVIFSLPLTPILYLLPFLLLFPNSEALVTALTYLIDLVRNGAGYAKKLSGAVISLRSDFAVIAIICAILTAVLVLFVKKKSFSKLILPLIAFFIVFLPPYFINRALNSDKTDLVCTNYSKNDMLVLSSCEKLLICDISDGSNNAASLAASYSKEEFETDEINVYMLTHYHRRHLSSVYKIASGYYLDTLLLPEPQTEKEKSISDAIVSSVKELDVKTVFYPADRDCRVALADAELTVVKREYLKRSTHPLVALSVKANDKAVSYLGSSFNETALSKDFLSAALSDSDMLIFGVHGPIMKKEIDFKSINKPMIFTGPDKNLPQSIDFNSIGGSVYRVDGKNGEYCIKIRFN